ncbi:MAG: hypothetical protein JWR69_11 [Pedosphaera sp.]|nr:hypothetical protein [Pedosphaera sp.]
MSAWITITLEDLNDYLAGAQVDAINTAATAEGQTDRFTKVSADIANRIRLKIESNFRNYISLTPGTIPPELKWVACYLIIEAMQTAIPGLLLSEDQRKQIEKADTQLTRIADGKEVVSKADDPEVPAESQRGGKIKQVSGNTRVATRNQLKGL